MAATAFQTFDGVSNFRDLADATLAAEGSTPGLLRPGRVYRTATPGQASDADAALVLTQLRVSTLLDLRSRDEWEAKAEEGPLQGRFEVRSFSREDDGACRGASGT